MSNKVSETALINTNMSRLLGCYELLDTNGRLGIILPETYMFSPSYSWLRFWLQDKLELKAMLNIPMEAFQGFCRAKTNFYIFEKVGD